MIATEATLALTVLALLEMAARVQVRPGPIAAAFSRDCWKCVADLEFHCDCLEAAQTLMSSAEKWLAEGSVAA